LKQLSNKQKDIHLDTHTHDSGAEAEMEGLLYSTTK